MTKKIEKIAAYANEGQSWNIHAKPDDLVNSHRRDVLRKYLGNPEETPSYTPFDWKFDTIKDKAWFKKNRAIAQEAFDRGYTRGYDDGAEQQRDTDVNRLLSFFDDIQREMKKIDENVKELDKA